MNILRTKVMSNIREKIKNIRRDFHAGAMDKVDLPSNPIKLLENWLEDAVSKELLEPNAFVLSTAINNQPDSRVLLLRDIQEDGRLIFFTNYGSKKGEDIISNNKVALNFFWRELDRQVRVQAGIQKLPDSESDIYFASRPRESQIGAWASKQSKVLASREELEQNIKKYQEMFEGKEVPRPDFWGGYIALPFYFEFWQGRENRLHDRVIYHTKEDEKWRMDRLSP